MLRYREFFDLTDDEIEFIINDIFHPIKVDNIQRDEEKDQKLNYMGWTVIHFWGKDILRNTEQCIKVVEETIFDIKLGDIEDEI